MKSNGKSLPFPALAGTVAAILAVALLAGSCTTAWRKNGSFFRTTKTRVAFGAPVPGKIYVNSRYAGDLPGTVPLEYGREIETRTRKVSYWQTDPGTAFLFTIASLGIYLPFSVIPVDIESSSVPLDSFRDNRFVVEVDAGARGKWTREIVLKGEEEMRIEPALGPELQSANAP